MTDRSLREIREQVDNLSDPSTGGEPLRRFGIRTGPSLEEEIEQAYDVLPPEKCDRLDDLLETIDEQGAYEDESDGVAEPTPAGKHLLCLVHGEAAEHSLEQRMGISHST